MTQPDMGTRANAFAVAQAQLDTAAEHLKLDPAAHALLKEPHKFPVPFYKMSEVVVGT